MLPGWHNPPDDCCVKWTADGKYFVFESGDQIWALPERTGLLRRAASEPIRLTSGPLSLGRPVPSKDGKKLFESVRSYAVNWSAITPSWANSNHFFPGSLQNKSPSRRMLSGWPTSRIPKEPCGEVKYFLDLTDNPGVFRVRISDDKEERVADLSKFKGSGVFGGYD